MAKTIVAPMTAPGRAAVAALRISGDKTGEILARLFRGKPADRTAVLGKIVDGQGQALDMAVVTFYKAPRSYTGEDVAEICLHGSPALLETVCGLCLDYGAVMAGRGEFTRRAFLAGKLDLTAAEGVMELIDAASPAELRAAAAHLCGNTYSEMRELRARLLSLAARLGAYVDYPDDEIGDISREELTGALCDLAREAEELERRAATGQSLRDGAQICLCGGVNVGKSSLMNRLMRADRSIVTDVPGTTRDVVSGTVVLGDAKFQLCDTAGLRETDDPVEKIGVDRSRATIESAAAVLAVLDGARPLAAEDRVMLDSLVGRPAIIVINKSDLDAALREEELTEYGLPVLRISALTGQGMPALEEALKGLAYRGESLDAGLIFSLRQADCLKRLSAAVREAHDAAAGGVTYDAVNVLIDEAIAAAGEMTGETVTQDVVQTIFDQFCVGK